jgi:hypothetical protein
MTGSVSMMYEAAFTNDLFTYFFHFIPHKQVLNANVNKVRSKAVWSFSVDSEIAAEYTLIEYTDMYLVLGKCRENFTVAVKQYAEKYLYRQVPSRRTLLPCVD